MYRCEIAVCARILRALRLGAIQSASVGKVGVPDSILLKPAPLDPRAASRSCARNTPSIKTSRRLLRGRGAKTAAKD